MNIATADELARKKCVPCEGDVPAIELEKAQSLLKGLPGWTLTADHKRIKKCWVSKNFMAGIAFFDQVAAVAEDEGHHPDLHLEGYRDVTIEIWTHAIGGLSENDFILAAKIDKIPISVRKSGGGGAANIPHA